MKKVSLFLVALTVLLSGCHISEGLAEGDKAVAKFHQQFNNEEFGEIYEQSGIEFRGVHNKEELIENFRDIRKEFGKFESIMHQGWTVNKDSFGIVTKINLKTQFEKGVGKERFIFLVNGNDVKLTSYEFEADSK